MTRPMIPALRRWRLEGYHAESIPSHRRQRRKGRKGQREAKHSLSCYCSELTTVISSLPPPSSTFPSPFFPSTFPPFPTLSPLPSLLPFLSLHVHNSLQRPWVRAYRLWLLVSAPFILKISTLKLSWGLCRLQWIIWGQCSPNRNLSVHVTH